MLHTWTPEQSAAARAEARALGADCDHCALNEHFCVPSERHAGALFTIVGEAPGGEERKRGKVFVGRSGQFTDVALKAIGVQRHEANWTNAILCSPPSDNLKALLPVHPNPVECCRPRLMRELADGPPNWLLLGKTATHSVLKTAESIESLRGSPVTLDAEGKETSDAERIVTRVMPSVHPAFVLRRKAFTSVFRADVGKAVRFFRGKLAWKPPEMLFRPSYEQLFKFFAYAKSHALPIAYDVETDGLEPMTANLRCIGLALVGGELRASVLVPFLGVDGLSGFYTESERARIVELLRAWFRSSELKVGHNAGYYDHLVIKYRLGVEPVNVRDTILYHRAHAGELPHKLGFVASYFTDVHAWKAERGGLDYTRDKDLWIYCLLDTACTGDIYLALRESIEFRDQQAVVDFDHKVQAVCRGLHEVGMPVDQVRRGEHERSLTARRDELYKKITDVAGAGFNPNSTKQVGALLFEQWGLPIGEGGLTETGLPRVDAEILREHMRSALLTEEQRALLDLIRLYKRLVKLLGTYILPGRDWGNRVYPSWNAHSVITGRLSSQGPNAQNFPRGLRDYVAPQPGHTLVGADMDQLELRMAAAVAGAGRYLEVFRSGGDPHAVTAEMIYGEAWTRASDVDKKKLRDFAKRFAYAVLYGAEIETIHQVIIATEGKDGSLPFAKTTVPEVASMRDRWLGAAPEFERWWDQAVDLQRAQGHLVDPVLGRRFDFHDSERNMIINAPIQASGSTLVHQATLDLLDEIPFFKWGLGTGIINQCHDSLTLQVPAEHAETTKKILTEVMCRQVPGLDVRFTATARAGRNWAEV